MEGLSNVEDGLEKKCNDNESRECNELMDVCVSNSDDDINWGDCDEKLRCLFDQVLMVLLRGVYAKNGVRPIPALLGDARPVDLFKLFCLVRDRGGFRSVSEDKLWGLIAEKFGFDYKLCASLKLIYFKYLDELDQWLNRITRDRVSANGSYECGGNLGLLSLELEKRFRDFPTNGKELGEKDGESGFYEICNSINVVLKENFHLPDSGNGSELQNGLIECTVDDDDKLCNSYDFAGKAKNCTLDSSRKRKRDVLEGMLSWIMKVAQNPHDFSVKNSGGSSKGKGYEEDDFCSVAISVREARLNRRYSYSNDEQTPLHQKKSKMHPSMYEDDIPLNSDEGLRCSKRRLTVVKTPRCHCCKSDSVDQCKLETDVKPPSENGSHIEERVKTDLAATNKVVVPAVDGVKTDLPATKKVVVPAVDDDPPVEKCVLLGPRFQADVPIWTGFISESDSKWAGTQIWVPDSQEENPLSQTELPGKGRPEFCKCRYPGSMECHRFHIAESRFKLRKKLGLAFYYWKFDRMGEEASLSWTIGDQMKFKHVIRLNAPHLGKSYFPKKRRTDLVSYYFNVFLISRRSYQNRVTPKEIDSDDDEKELGSVGETFGYNAIKPPTSEPLTCYLNEQVFDLD